MKQINGGRGWNELIKKTTFLITREPDTSKPAAYFRIIELSSRFHKLRIHLPFFF